MADDKIKLASGTEVPSNNPGAEDAGKLYMVGTSGALELKTPAEAGLAETSFFTPGDGTPANGDILIRESGKMEPKTPDEANLLTKNTAQTIVGVKTFDASAIPLIGGDPSENNHAVRKSYADGLVDSGGSGGDVSGPLSNLQIDTVFGGQSLSSVIDAHSPGGDISGSIATATVGKIKGVDLGSVTATNGYVLGANGTQWDSKSPNDAGLVDTSSNQTIAGEKNFTDDVDMSHASIGRMEYTKLRLVYDFDEPAAALASTFIAKAKFAGGGTSGTQAIIEGVGGIMELDTGSTGSQSSTLTQRNASIIKTSKEPELHVLAKTDALTNRKVTFGLYKDANNYVMFEFDTDNGTTPENWKIVSNNAGVGEVETDTGIAAVGDTYLDFVIEVDASGNISASIGGVDCAAHSGTIADDVFAMYALINNKAVAQSNKILIDYFILEQNR